MLIGKYFINCPLCGELMVYKSEKTMNNSRNHTRLCRKCQTKKRNNKGCWERLCPSCGDKVRYSNKWIKKTADNKNSECKSCALSGSKNPRYGKTGALSTFYGKSHSKETKEKISLKKRGRKLSESHRLKLKKYYATHDGGMKGRSVYSVWVEKFGKCKADEMKEKLRKTQSANSSGEKNPMFGKPSPRGAGVGFKGWYKGFYFRSLRELSYIINLDKNNTKWKSCETKEFAIEYEFLNRKRTYRPDFFVSNCIVEIKPLRLHKTPLILAKSNAAMKFCRERGFKFAIIDFQINRKLIYEKFDSGDVIFDRGYMQKFLDYSEK